MPLTDVDRARHRREQQLRRHETRFAVTWHDWLQDARKVIGYALNERHAARAAVAINSAHQHPGERIEVAVTPETRERPLWPGMRPEAFGRPPAPRPPQPTVLDLLPPDHPAPVHSPGQVLAGGLLDLIAEP